MKALIRLGISWISNLTAVRLELAVLLSFEEGVVIFWLGVEKGGVSICGGGGLYKEKISKNNLLVISII